MIRVGRWPWVGERLVGACVREFQYVGARSDVWACARARVCREKSWKWKLSWIYFADFDFVVLQHLLIAQDLALDIANHDVSIAISILLLGGALGLDKNLISIFHEAHVFLRFLVFGKNLDLEK